MAIGDTFLFPVGTNSGTWLVPGKKLGFTLSSKKQEDGTIEVKRHK